ncbi:hypothetical protein GCM10023259_094580 [Thermocatellispora tengchongensis]
MTVDVHDIYRYSGSIPANRRGAAGGMRAAPAKCVGVPLTARQAAAGRALAGEVPLFGGPPRVPFSPAPA